MAGRRQGPPSEHYRVCVDMRSFSSSRPPQRDESNVSSVQTAAVSNDNGPDAGTTVIGHATLSGRGPEYEVGYVVYHTPPSNQSNDTSNTESTVRDESGDRLGLEPLRGVVPHLPVQPLDLTMANLELNGRQCCCFHPSDIAGWAADATPPYSRSRIKTPSTPSSLFVEKRSKASCMSMESNPCRTAVVDLGYEAVRHDIVLAGVWAVEEPFDRLDGHPEGW